MIKNQFKTFFVKYNTKINPLDKVYVVVTEGTGSRLDLRRFSGKTGYEDALTIAGSHTNAVVSSESYIKAKYGK